MVEEIGKIRKDLERLTNSLNLEVPAIEAEKMPEYLEARTALENYKFAIQDKIDKLNGKYKLSGKYK
jgi:hypothetical protein